MVLVGRATTRVAPTGPLHNSRHSGVSVDTTHAGSGWVGQNPLSSPWERVRVTRNGPKGRGMERTEEYVVQRSPTGWSVVDWLVVLVWLVGAVREPPLRLGHLHGCTGLGGGRRGVARLRSLTLREGVLCTTARTGSRSEDLRVFPFFPTPLDGRSVR